MTLAHLSGLPVEEWLTPLVATGGSVVLGLRAILGRRPRRIRD